LKFDRCKKLFGDRFSSITKAKVILLGVGGVGSFTLDCLYRSGVRDITIVDFDIFEESNQNRQIGSEALGEYKTEALKKLYPQISTINTKITPEWVKEFDFSSYDLILDAMDDIPSKIELIIKEHKKLILTTGSAKRVNPTEIELTSIWKTYNDPFARKIREGLKKRGFKKNIKVIFSKEEPKCKELGSFVGVTGSFGLALCSQAIDRVK
jgi:tRNA A37 threonylcarbamoyladenosine dehydratase